MKKVDIAGMQKKLSSEQYNICFLKGTEPPFSGKYAHTTARGKYVCVVCSNELFSSTTKFDSNTGWPSFDDVLASDNVKLANDFSAGAKRVEVMCNRCGAHLGHLFDDGPTQTRKRYCINSLALDFVREK